MRTQFNLSLTWEPWLAAGGRAAVVPGPAELVVFLTYSMTCILCCFCAGFYPPAVLPLLIVFSITTVETVGDVTATEELSQIEADGPNHNRRIKGGMLNGEAATGCHIRPVYCPSCVLLSMLTLSSCGVR